MFDAVNILKSMVSFDKAEQLDGYSKVVVIVSDEIEYTAGTDTGRTLTLNCPWGTQEIANNILQSIRGFQYQPMTAKSALVDPSVEIGDGISANGVYSGVYSLETKFNSNLPTTVSAPADEEIDEEFPYKSSMERTVERQSREVRALLSIQSDRITAEVSAREDAVNEINAQLAIQADQISAKVSQTGGNSSSFAWELLSTAFKLKSNGQDVFIADKNGVQIVGKITATSGKIGGFDILQNYLSYNNQTWGGTNTIGAYIGTSGIQFGRNFRVDSSGNLYAENGYFNGVVQAGNISYGGSSGYMDGGAISTGSIWGGSDGQIGGSSLSTFNMTGGINLSLSYADWSYGVLNGWTELNNLRVRTITSSADMTAANFYLNGYKISRKSGTFKNSSGENVFIRYLSW